MRGLWLKAYVRFVSKSTNDDVAASGPVDTAAAHARDASVPVCKSVLASKSGAVVGRGSEARLNASDSKLSPSASRDEHGGSKFSMLQLALSGSRQAWLRAVLQNCAAVNVHVPTYW